MLLSSRANTDRKISDQVISKLDTIVLLGHDVELGPQEVYLAAAAHVKPTEMCINKKQPTILPPACIKLI